MRERFHQYLAAAAVALVFVLIVVVFGALSEGHTGPDGGCPDRVCADKENQ